MKPSYMYIKVAWEATRFPFWLRLCYILENEAKPNQCAYNNDSNHKIRGSQIIPLNQHKSWFANLQNLFFSTMRKFIRLERLLCLCFCFVLNCIFTYGPTNSMFTLVNSFNYWIKICIRNKMCGKGKTFAKFKV
jgi:hypothetical protein